MKKVTRKISPQQLQILCVDFVLNETFNLDDDEFLFPVLIILKQN